jgi:hypothetical protein
MPFHPFFIHLFPVRVYREAIIDVIFDFLEFPRLSIASQWLVISRKYALLLHLPGTCRPHGADRVGSKRSSPLFTLP